MDLAGIISLAFGLGLLHAFDADHIAAVSGLSVGGRNAVSFSLHWGVGHGLSIFLLGSLVFIFGVSLPEQFSSVAEFGVGLFLLGIGLLLLLDLIRQRYVFCRLTENEPPTYAGLEFPGNNEDVHHHSALMVGSLHGVAGSASLLALLPVTRIDSPLLAMGYLIVFCAGVLISMLFFGGLFGSFCKYLSGMNCLLPELLRAVVAIISMGVGINLVAGMNL